MFPTLSLVLTLEILLSQASANDNMNCPVGYEQFYSNDTKKISCIQVECNNWSPESWVNVDRKCKAMGGLLSIIDTEEEASWIIGKALSYNEKCLGVLVNAHASLYAESPAWFGGITIKTGKGQAIEKVIRSNSEKLCQKEDFSLVKECYYMNAQRTLVDIDCSTTMKNLGYACKIDSRNKTINIVGSSSNTWIMPDPPVTPGNSCYNFISPTSSKITSWLAQHRYCREAGGELAVIENEKELNWINWYAANHVYYSSNRYMNGWAVDFHESWYGPVIKWRNGMDFSFGTFLDDKGCETYRNCGFFVLNMGWLKMWCSCSDCFHHFICKQDTCNGILVRKVPLGEATSIGSGTAFITII